MRGTVWLRTPWLLNSYRALYENGARPPSRERRLSANGLRQLCRPKSRVAGRYRTFFRLPRFPPPYDPFFYNGPSHNLVMWTNHTGQGYRFASHDPGAGSGRDPRGLLDYYCFVLFFPTLSRFVSDLSCVCWA